MTRPRALLLVGLAIGIATAACTSARDVELVDRARATLEHLFAGDYAAVRIDFDETMTAQLSEEGLAEAREQFEGLFGTFEGMGDPDVLHRGDYTVIDVPLHMSRRAGKGRVSYDQKGKVAGLYLLEPGVPVPNS